jgi:hypothetical protein
LLHLLYELEQATVIGLRAADDISCTSQDMVAVLHTAHQGIELLAAVAAAHDDGSSPRLAYGVEELVYEYV